MIHLRIGPNGEGCVHLSSHLGQRVWDLNSRLTLNLYDSSNLFMMFGNRLCTVERERERENFIEINRKHDDTCTNTNYNEGLCGLIQGDLH